MFNGFVGGLLKLIFIGWVMTLELVEEPGAVPPNVYAPKKLINAIDNKDFVILFLINDLGNQLFSDISARPARASVNFEQ